MLFRPKLVRLLAQVRLCIECIPFRCSHVYSWLQLIRLTFGHSGSRVEESSGKSLFVETVPSGRTENLDFSLPPNFLVYFLPRRYPQHPFCPQRQLPSCVICFARLLFFLYLPKASRCTHLTRWSTYTVNIESFWTVKSNRTLNSRAVRGRSQQNRKNTFLPTDTSTVEPCYNTDITNYQI